MTAPTEDLIELIERRIGQEFDGEAHLTEVEARSIAQALRSLQAEVERMTRTLGEIVDQCPATCELSLAHSMADIARSALNTGSGEG